MAFDGALFEVDFIRLRGLRGEREREVRTNALATAERRRGGSGNGQVDSKYHPHGGPSDTYKGNAHLIIKPSQIIKKNEPLNFVPRPLGGRLRGPSTYLTFLEGPNAHRRCSTSPAPSP